MTWIVGAKVAGQEHRRREVNVQDAFFVGGTPEGFVLVVSDGCGSTRAAEVGAALSVEVAGAYVLGRLSRGDAALAAAKRVGGAVAERLGRVAACVPRAERARFVEDHLFATLLVVAASRTEVAIAVHGDGVVWADERATVIDQGGAPRYVAHALLGDAGALDATYTWSGPRGRVARVAVATDGMDQALMQGVFGRPKRGLARWLNVLRDRHPLRDDTAVALAEEGAA